MTAARPDPSRGLGVAGRRAWRAALAGLDDDVQFTAKELESVRLVAGQADYVDRLERELAATPSLAVTDTQGNVRRHPLAGLLSSARLAQARLLAEVRLEVDAAEGLPVGTVERSVRRRRAGGRGVRSPSSVEG